MKTGTWVKIGILLLALVLGGYLGYQQLQPPKALGALPENDITITQAQAGPDLQLMLSHIKAMASQVHSVDSDGIRVTQAYLTGQLAGMGYSYQKDEYQLSMNEVLALQKERADYRKVDFNDTEAGSREYSGIGDKPTMNLTNIYVHADAPGTDETIIFVAHTDSVKMGPGAFDDIVSVAAMLEGMRQLNHLALKRDLVFLFTDGEEQGLLGAALFVRDHPEFQAITRLVINLEARGNQGALLMFETSGNNLGIVTEYNKAVSMPHSFSIATAVYQSMQNDTDLTRFFMKGYPGMNLAVIQGAEVYHTPADNIETYSRDSAQHYLDTATELISHFAASDNLQLESKENSVHFPLFPGNMVVLSQTAANMISFAAFLMTIILLIGLILSKQVKPGSLVLSVAVQLIWTAAAAGLAYLVVNQVIKANNLSGYKEILQLESAQPIFYAMLAVSILVSLIVFRVLAKLSKSPFSAALGVLIVPSLLALATTFVFPSVNYLFALPVLAGLVVILLSLIFRPGAAVYGALGSVLILLLFVPIVLLVYVALSFESAYLSIALAQFPLTIIWGLFGLSERKISI
jgi:hypothetical protein